MCFALSLPGRSPCSSMKGLNPPQKTCRSPTRGLPISSSILNGLLHTHTHTEKKKITRAGVLQVNRIHWGFQRIKDVFPSCALFRAAVPRDFTCRVLSRDKGLSAERLSARYPAGNTYQAALQVWQKIRRKKIFKRLVIGKCQQSARTTAFLKITRETTALHYDKFVGQFWQGRRVNLFCSILFPSHSSSSQYQTTFLFCRNHKNQGWSAKKEKSKKFSSAKQGSGVWCSFKNLQTNCNFITSLRLDAGVGLVPNDFSLLSRVVQASIYL